MLFKLLSSCLAFSACMVQLRKLGELEQGEEHPWVLLACIWVPRAGPRPGRSHPFPQPSLLGTWSTPQEEGGS